MKRRMLEGSLKTMLPSPSRSSGSRSTGLADVISSLKSPFRILTVGTVRWLNCPERLPRMPS